MAGQGLHPFRVKWHLCPRTAGAHLFEIWIGLLAFGEDILHLRTEALFSLFRLFASEALFRTDNNAYRTALVAYRQDQEAAKAEGAQVQGGEV